jgi:hypothetical protein
MRNLQDFRTRFQALETLGVDGFIAAALQTARGGPEASRARGAGRWGAPRPMREERAFPPVSAQARKRSRAGQR